MLRISPLTVGAGVKLAGMLRLGDMMAWLGIIAVIVVLLQVLAPALKAITFGGQAFGLLFLAIIFLEWIGHRWYSILGVFATWGALLVAGYMFLRGHLTSPSLPPS